MFMDSFGVSFADAALGLLAALKARQSWQDYRKSEQPKASPPGTPGAHEAPVAQNFDTDENCRICRILRPDGTFHSTRPVGHPDLDEFRKEGFQILAP